MFATMRTPLEEQAPNCYSKVPTVPARKRARKGTCALCTTCPCNYNGASNSSAEVSTFARSDAAIEKALIRRVQKLEKACEIDETRMEIARRKLKHHRREMWKKRESKSKSKHPSKSTSNETQFSFLPEADEMLGGGKYEDSQVLPPEIVRNAQKVIFPDTACVQATLTQILRSSTKKRSVDKEDISEVTGVENVCDQDSDEGSLEIAENGKKENDEYPTEYKEYSRGADFDGNFTRLEWKSNSVMSSTETFSLWRNAAKTDGSSELETSSLTQLTQVCSNNAEQAGCPWDFLFHDDDDVDYRTRSGRNGLEELVGLFDDAFGSNKDSTRIDGTNHKYAQAQVNFSDLSQVAYEKATELLLSLEEDPCRRKLLESACPNWKENLAFCMKQAKDDVRLALEKVRRKRKQMFELKCGILEAWERQDAVLSFFEDGLNSSLTRFSPSQLTDETDRDCLENCLGDERSFDSSSICRNEDDYDDNSCDYDQRVLSH